MMEDQLPPNCGTGNCIPEYIATRIHEGIWLRLVQTSAYNQAVGHSPNLICIELGKAAKTDSMKSLDLRIDNPLEGPRTILENVDQGAHAIPIR